MTPIQVCNENEQMGQKEMQNVQFEEKRTSGNLILEPKLLLTKVEGIQMPIKESGALGVRPPTQIILQFIKWAKELSVPKEHQQREPYANVVQGRGQVPPQWGSLTWLNRLCGSGFGVIGYGNKGIVESSSTVKENHWDQVCDREGVLLGVPEKPLCEAVEMKPDHVGDVRSMRYLPRRTEYRECTQPKREQCVAVSKTEEQSKPSPLTRDVEFSQLSFFLALVSSSSLCLHSFLLEW